MDINGLSSDLTAAVRDFSLRLDHRKLASCATALFNGDEREKHMGLLILSMLSGRDPDQLSLLGDKYDQGELVRTDEGKALSMLRSAAEQGSGRAGYDLGWYFYDRSDYLRAIEAFKTCIAPSSPVLSESQMGKVYTCIGDCYTKILEPSFDRAAEYLSIGADKYLDLFANRRLGMLYSEKNSPHYNPAKSMRYFETAASYGDFPSVHRLAQYYLFGEDTAGIAPDEAKAEALLLRYADSHYADILCDLGKIYLRRASDGGAATDFSRARGYYEQAWEMYKGADIAADLGYLYYNCGEYQKAETMLLRADAENYCSYSDFLGRIYKDGLAGRTDLQKAAYYYGRTYKTGSMNNFFTCSEYVKLLDDLGDYELSFEVAEHGKEEYNDIAFHYQIAKLVLHGKVRGLPMEDAAEIMESCCEYDSFEGISHMDLGNYYSSTRQFMRAVKHYTAAFEHGIADAGVSVGRIYENGGGSVAADVNMAYTWYTKAADAGSSLGVAEAACFKSGLFGGYKRVRSCTL